MTPAPFLSPLTAPFFGDAEAADILSDDCFAAQMVRVEAAFARACGLVGLIPAEAAARISARLEGMQPDLEELGTGLASAGVPVPALVAQLQAVLGQDAPFLHWGATSQDIIDCAHLLQWRALIDLLNGRLSALLDGLEAASTEHANTLMAARTRSQIAAPVTFGLRIATWAQPLIAAEAALPAMRAALLRVQFGGAAGSAAAVGSKSTALSAALADELGLRDAPCWHGDRSGILALGAWLTTLTSGLSKMARDLILLGRSEAAEASAGVGGASSTMPQKSNPVAAETVVALAEYAACLHPALIRAASPAEERDGAAWALEWLALPQMGVAAASALRLMTGLIGTVTADPARMTAHLSTDHGAALAEAASFALAAHMPRPEAVVLVKEALALARAEGTDLAQALARHSRSGTLEDWPLRLDMVGQVDAAEAMRRRILAQRA